MDLDRTCYPLKSKGQNMVIRCVALLLLLTSTGCAMVDKEVSQFIGQNQNALVGRYGAPSQVMDDGSGGKIWVFAIDKTYVAPGYAYTDTQTNMYTQGQINQNGYFNANTQARSTGSGYYVPPQRQGYIATRTFWIRRDGTIYQAAWRGL